MRTEDEMIDCVVSFVSATRFEQSKNEMATELASIGLHGARVPKASFSSWCKTIDTAIQKGLLVDAGGIVRAPEKESDEQTQMMLF